MSILLYVDDLGIACVELKEIDRIKPNFTTSFKMKDLGALKDLRDLHYFLGIEVIHTPEGILINKRHYVLSMLFKFRMMECKSVLTPLEQNLKLHQGSGKECVETQIERSLIYVTITRPNLSYSVGLISKFMS